MRLFKHNKTVINFDNDTDAEAFATANPGAEELDAEEIASVFGDYPHLAGPETTTVEDSNIVFTLPLEYRDLDAWFDSFIRPNRDASLLKTDKYLVSDYPIDATTLEEIKVYRQALRDFPATFTEIVPLETIQWPAAPETILNVN
jgi:hypothetical protein